MEAQPTRGQGWWTGRGACLPARGRPRPQRLGKPGRQPGSHRCVLSLVACPSTAPLLPPTPAPIDTLLSSPPRPQDGGGGSRSSQLRPRP